MDNFDWLSLWLPLVLGVLAVYLFLPRPRPYARWLAALCGTLALVAAGGLLVRAGAATPEVILFYAFSFIAVVSGGMMLAQSNPVHAALSFALVVLSTCGLFLLQAAPFLMAATIIVYAGAIVVTFLFVIMLAQQAGRSDADRRSREPLLASLAGFALLGAILYLLHVQYSAPELDAYLARLEAAKEAPTKETMLAQLGDEEKFLPDLGALPTQPPGFLDRPTVERRLETTHSLQDFMNDWEVAKQSDDLERMRKVLDELSEQVRRLRDDYGSEAPSSRARPLSPFSLGPGALEEEIGAPAPGRMPADNPGWLGRTLFSDFLVPVELAGTLLLIAAVGAIAIAHRHSEE